MPRLPLGDLPRILDQLVALSDVVFVAAGIVGLVVLLLRDRWFGLLLGLLAVLNVYIYANYLGDLPHYLLTTWLILAIGVAIGAETVIRAAIRWLGDRAAVVQVVVFLLPIALLAANWPVHDQSANHDGEKFAAEVFAQLPPNAVLITYWDALTTLSYEHCNAGVRPDVSLRAYDSYALVTCDKVEAPATSIAEGRPVFALQVQDAGIAAATGLEPVPVSTIKVPWGERYPSLDRTLYQLVVPGTAP